MRNCVSIVLGKEEITLKINQKADRGMLESKDTRTKKTISK